MERIEFLLKEIRTVCEAEGYEFLYVHTSGKNKSFGRFNEGKFMAVLPPTCIFEFLEDQSPCRCRCIDKGNKCWAPVDSEPVLACNPENAITISRFGVPLGS